MSNDINKMDFKQLRNEVQYLRDELAIFKRKYEDIIYNLDNDNFSSKLIREKNDMKTEIEVNAEGIKTKVSNEEFESTKTQLANQITSEVKNVNDTLSSRITQTANSIESTVKSVVDDVYIKDKLGNEYLTDATFRSNLQQDSYGIYATVESNYETKANANSNYGSLIGSISNVSVKANGISSRVADIEGGEFNGYTLFEQTASKFSFTGNVEISGSAIVGGIITGAALQNATGTTQIVLGHETGSTVGDMLLNRIDSAGNEQTIFSVIDNWQSIDLVGMGSTFLTATGTVAKPKGTWDFEGAKVEGFEVSATAVFG